MIYFRIALIELKTINGQLKCQVYNNFSQVTGLAQILSLNEYPTPHLIQIIGESLKKNQTVILPTDTIYGFFAPYNNVLLEKKIREIKVRDTKPFIHLVSSREELLGYSSTRIPDFILNALPAPLTLIVESAKISGGNSSVAFRYPDNSFLVELVKYCGVPCLSTSANISGEPMPETEEGIVELFYNSTDIIITGGKINTAASTILDIRQRPFQILREGAYPVPEAWVKEKK